MAEGSIEDHLIGITKQTIDRLLKMENPGDCIALYTFYAYTRKWQKNNAVYATSDFAMTGLGWGRERFAKAKSQLKEQGFIEDIQRKDQSGKVIGWYVGVRFAQNATLGNFSVTELPENHPTGFPQGGSSTVWENRSQIPINGNEIPNTNNKMQLKEGREEDLFSPAIAGDNKPKRQPKLADDEFISELKRIHPRIDIDSELRKMDAWLLNNPSRKKTRQFVTNWLNRVQVPLATQQPSWKPRTI